MPAPKPPEFRRRAVELARRRDQPIAQSPGIRPFRSPVFDGGWIRTYVDRSRLFVRWLADDFHFRGPNA